MLKGLAERESSHNVNNAAVTPIQIVTRGAIFYREFADARIFSARLGVVWQFLSCAGRANLYSNTHALPLSGRIYLNMSAPTPRSWLWRLSI